MFFFLPYVFTILLFQFRMYMFTRDIYNTWKIILMQNYSNLLFLIYIFVHYSNNNNYSCVSTRTISSNVINSNNTNAHVYVRVCKQKGKSYCIQFCIIIHFCSTCINETLCMHVRWGKVKEESWKNNFLYSFTLLYIFFFLFFILYMCCKQQPLVFCILCTCHCCCCCWKMKINIWILHSRTFARIHTHTHNIIQTQAKCVKKRKYNFYFQNNLLTHVFAYVYDIKKKSWVIIIHNIYIKHF